MQKQIRILYLLLFITIGSCSKEQTTEIDTEHPVIDITATTHFPKQCDELKRGETFVFRARFTDNVELGSSSIDIHHNFDHHTHSTEVEECNLQPQKRPDNPFLYIKNYPIPARLRVYELEQEVSIPADIDLGDYHFMIRLTDKEGWQTIKGLSIKIVD